MASIAITSSVCEEAHSSIDLCQLHREIKLAIVIPAYKGTFLRTTLQSLSRQGNQHFNVYVGDDCSPDDIRSICAEFVPLLNIIYCRFESNLGKISLPRHWQRCINLSSEPWIWLFSDDDVMSPECVEALYREWGGKSASFHCLYRFNTYTINDGSNTIENNYPHPPFESNFDFLIARLNKWRKSFACEYIFSREVFMRYGVEDFPLAWCSDDATWIRYGESGIVTLAEGMVGWRSSTQNISGQTGDLYKISKAIAAFAFRLWVKRYFKQFLKNNPGRNKIFRQSMAFGIKQQIFLHSGFFGIKDIFKIAFALPEGRIYAVIYLCYANLLTLTSALKDGKYKH